MAGNDANTILLIQSDTSDGSTTFVDTAIGGNAPHTVTGLNGAHHETDEQKFGATSIAFDGTDDRLDVDDDADWDSVFGAGDFTVDFWVYHTQAIGSYENWIVRNVEGGTQCFIMRRTDGGKLQVLLSSDGGSWNIINAVSTESITSDAWHHIAIVRSSTTLYAFNDGTALTLDNTDATGTIFASALDLHIGVEDPIGNVNIFEGYMDEIRLSDTARWTSGFTPPTESYSEGGVTLEISVADCVSQKESLR